MKEKSLEPPFSGQPERIQIMFITERVNCSLHISYKPFADMQRTEEFTNKVPYMNRSLAKLIIYTGKCLCHLPSIPQAYLLMLINNHLIIQ